MNKTMMKTAALLLAACGVAPSAEAASGTYYLDFDPASPGPMVHLYTDGEKAAILDGLTEMYAPFPLTFTLTEPVGIEYTPVSFNTAAIGTSSGIDFRNVDPLDTAAVNALLGIDFASPGYSPSPTEIINASINLAGHEIGHNEGLRHHDSFGPIGGGLPSPAPGAAYDPVYPGPTDAFLSSENVMSLTTATSGGFSLAKLTSAPLAVGQRSHQKLAFNTAPNFFTETALGSGKHDTPASAFDLPLAPYILPNPVPEPDPGSELDFVAEMIAVSGDIDPDPDLGGAGESDYYVFLGVAEARVQIEVMSEAIDSSRPAFDAFDTAVAIFDPDDLGASIYYGDFTNNDEIESTDSLMIDFVVPESKTYIIEVFGASPGDTGDYELFVSQFFVVPEPSSLALLGVAGMVALRRRCR